MCCYVLLTCYLLIIFYLLFKRTKQLWQNLFLFTNSSIFLFFLTYHLKSLSLTPCITKRNHVWNIIWSFSFVTLWKIFLFVWKVLYERSCSTKGATQHSSITRIDYYSNVSRTLKMYDRKCFTERANSKPCRWDWSCKNVHERATVYTEKISERLKWWRGTQQ